jgi:hypothetical protein
VTLLGKAPTVEETHPEAYALVLPRWEDSAFIRAAGRLRADFLCQSSRARHHDSAGS